MRRTGVLAGNGLDVAGVSAVYKVPQTRDVRLTKEYHQSVLRKRRYSKQGSVYSIVKNVNSPSKLLIEKPASIARKLEAPSNP